MCKLQKVFVDMVGLVIPLTTWKPDDTNVSLTKASASQKFVVKAVLKDN